MKTKKLLSINYTIFMLIAAWLVFEHMSTPHNFEYSEEDIQALVEKLNKSLEHKIIISENSNSQAKKGGSEINKNIDNSILKGIVNFSSIKSSGI